MKIIFCVILSLIPSNFRVDAGAVDLVKKLDKLNNGDYETKITDLNEDCLFLIFEHFTFGDLLRMAQIDERFPTVAADVFRHKHSHFRINLYQKIPLPENRHELLSIAGMDIDIDTIERLNEGMGFAEPPNVFNNEISLRNGDQILNTFKHFGHVIKNIKTTILPDEPPLRGELVGELIGKLISKYSSESLTEICIASNAKAVLDHITNPLINVEKVGFHGTERNIDYQGIRFNEIFPSVRRLDLTYLTNHSHAHFNYRIPNLEHVTFSAFKYNSFYPTVIVNNPQIKSIANENMHPEFYQQVSILHPNLEKLSIFGSKSEINLNIRFPNVNTLSIKYHTSPAGLHFPRLQTLNIDFEQWEFDDYYGFLNEHNYLRHLHFNYWNMNDAQFQRLTESLTNLMELTLSLDFNRTQPLSTAAISEFLRSHANVKKLNVIKYPDDQKVELQEQLKHEWNAQINGSSLSFQRK